MYKIGRSTGYYFKLTDEDMEEHRKSGMTYIEHCMAIRQYYEPAYVAQMAARHDVKLWSCHLPYFPYELYDPSSPDKEKRKRTFDRCTEEIVKSAAVGVDKFVLHPGIPFEDESERPDRLKCSMEFLNELAEFAHREGAVIAVEDMPHCIGRSVDEIEALVSVNPKLRVCFDVNHLLNNTHSQFIDRLGDRIVTVHLSDYDLVEEKHWFPKEGKIDWVSLMAKLYGSGYKGIWMYECKPMERTPQMFYDTAAEILRKAGVPETV